MAKAKAHKAPEAEAAETGIPTEQQEFTTKARGGHGVYLQRMEVVPNGNKGNRVVKRGVMARLQRNVKFNPFLECGPEGRNPTFRDLDPTEAWQALKALAEDRNSDVVYWDDRPMTEEQSEHARELKAAKTEASEQAKANARLRKVIEENGLKVPEDL